MKYEMADYFGLNEFLDGLMLWQGSNTGSPYRLTALKYWISEPFGRTEIRHGRRLEIG